MANKEAWSDRSGDDKRATYMRFAALYVALLVVALLLGWTVIAIIAGLIILVLGGLWFSTSAGQAELPPDRPKPDWLKAMEEDGTAPGFRVDQPNQEPPPSPEV